MLTPDGACWPKNQHESSPDPCDCGRPGKVFVDMKCHSHPILFLLSPTKLLLSVSCHHPHSMMHLLLRSTAKELAQVTQAWKAQVMEGTGRMDRVMETGRTVPVMVETGRTAFMDAV